jgi:hypothetical protein
MSVIDIHPHIVSPDTKKYPLAPLGGKQSTWSEERPTTYQDMIKAMDEAGVDKSALVHSSTAYGYDNSYVADAVAAVPSRFTGVYSMYWRLTQSRHSIIGLGAAAPVCGCSLQVQRCRTKRRFLPIQRATRSGNMRRQRTFRSACR